jgi:hypothetical protein
VEEARSNSKARIMGVKMIPSDPKFNTPLDMINPEYILEVVEQAYGPRVQQIYKSTYMRPYPEYIDRMYLYPTPPILDS